MKQEIMGVRYLDDTGGIDKSKWDELLAVSNYGSVFQTDSFLGFIAGCAGNEPFIFIEEREGKYELLLAGTIQYESNKLTNKVSRRAIVNGGLVSRRKNPEHETLLLFLRYVVSQLKNRAVYLEIRNLSDYSDLIPVFRGAGFTYVPHLNFHVDTQDLQASFKKLSQSRRRQVKKSLDAGARIIVAENSDDVKQFYRILERTYKNRVRRPLPDENFFIRFLESGPGLFLLISYESKIIAGIMCPVYKNKVIYEWYIAGDDSHYRDIYPSVLATWAAIEYASRNGIDTFDFMGAGNPGENYGVREFKAKFGGRQVEYGRFLSVFNKPVYVAGKAYIRFKGLFR